MFYLPETGSYNTALACGFSSVQSVDVPTEAVQVPDHSIQKTTASSGLGGCHIFNVYFYHNAHEIMKMGNGPPLYTLELVLALYCTVLYCTLFSRPK